MNVLEETTNKGSQMKKVSSRDGGEYHGPCPSCGGNDRFHVWPEQNDGDGSYWCRGCKKAGDLIQFFIDFDGMSYPDACRRAGKDPKSPEIHRNFTPGVEKQPVKNEFSPKIYDNPCDLWQQKAAAFVGYCHEKLLDDQYQLAYLAGRGIKMESVIHFQLGYNPGNNGKDYFRPREAWGLPSEISDKTNKPKKLWIPRGIVIPYLSVDGVVRIRIRRENLNPGEKNRYYIVPGSGMSPMMINPERRAHLVIEAELDAILVSQDAGDLVGCLAMGSSHTKPDEKSYDILKRSFCIINALDYDDAGSGGSDWWSDEFRQSRRRPVSFGKDPGDLVSAGMEIRPWVIGNLPDALRLGLINQTLSDQGGAGRKKENPEVVANQPAPAVSSEKTMSIPESVTRLAELLKKSPVRIQYSSGRTHIMHKKEWGYKNWNVLREISTLAMSDSDCIAFFETHPYREEIAGWNIFKKDSGE